MSLLAQFQTFLGSVLAGALFLFAWTLFNRIFYSRRLWPLRLLPECGLMVFFAYCYYCFLSYFADGIFNVFYLLGIALGGWIYLKFYAVHFERLFEQTAGSLVRCLWNPIRLKRKKIHDKLKARRLERRKKHGRQIEADQSPH